MAIPPGLQQPYPVLGPYLQVIDQWLEEDKERPKKQRHTARRIYDRLVREHGFTGGDSTVRHYVRKAKMRLGVQVTQGLYSPGAGSVARKPRWTGALPRPSLAARRHRSSFSACGPSIPANTSCAATRVNGSRPFWTAISRPLRFSGASFPTLIYDNLTAAVHKVLRGKGRVEQEEFTKFHAYYNFTPRFCNPASGPRERWRRGPGGLCQAQLPGSHAGGREL